MISGVTENNLLIIPLLSSYCHTRCFSWGLNSQQRESKREREGGLISEASAAGNTGQAFQLVSMGPINNQHVRLWKAQANS